ncbi:MAG: ABC transporter permease [Spirochaetia bacterium]
MNKSKRGLLLIPGFIALIPMVFAFLMLLVMGFLDKESFWNGSYRFTFFNYLEISRQPYFIRLFAYTIGNSILVSALSLVIGYPFAYILARTKSKLNSFAELVLVFPLYGWVYFCYGLVYLFLPNGIVNGVLQGLHLISKPLMLWQSRELVIIALTLLTVPFIVFPVRSSILAIDPALVEAASSLGANPVQSFLRITLPLSKSGILGATLIGFAINTGSLVVPLIIGGARVEWLGIAMYIRMSKMLDWGVGASLATILFFLTFIVSFLYSRITKEQ